MPNNTMQGSKSTLVSLMLALLIVVIVVIGGMHLWLGQSSGLSGVNGSEFQAAFLSNGQVYFGKLSGVNDKYVKLTNIYYLQAPQQNVQPGNNQQQTPTQLTVVKLGNELHGPEDSMFIARSQLLFWENLKDSGKVVQAIKNPPKQ